MALDRGVAAQFTRMLQRGEISKTFRVLTANGCVETSERPEGEKVQLAMLRFRDLMGKDEEIELEVDIPREWRRNDH